MISPESFYQHDEHPTGKQQERMWDEIERRSPWTSRRAPIFAIADKRSFVYGIAASFILYFSLLGLWTTAKNAIDSAKPVAIKLDKAYESAIQEFESVVPSVLQRTSNTTPQEQDLIASRTDQLRMVNAAINELRNETASNDLSPAKRTRLRELYSMKLHILQQMIENGEIEL